MSSLRRIPGGYEMDCALARDRLIGAPGALVRGLRRPEAGKRAALLEAQRASFSIGFLEMLASHTPCLLAPSQRLLDALPDAPQRVPLVEKEDSDLTTTRFAPDDTICQLLTSGSTGHPERFDKSARQLFEEGITLAEHLNWSPPDTVLLTTALHHLYGLLFGLVTPWASGSKIVVHEDSDPGAFHPVKVARLAKEHGVTRLVTVPAHLQTLLEAPIELPSVVQIISSAAALEQRDARALEEKFDVEVIDVLGSTETGGIATRLAAKTSRWSPLPSVNATLNGGGRLLVTSHFLPRPDEPFASTERARLHEDGTFEYLGRADGVVKIGGKRIALSTIEAFVRGMDGVSDCAALEREVSSLRGREILLVVVGQNLAPGKIRKGLREHIDPVFIPRKIRILPALPRDERGKLKRATLLKMFPRVDRVVESVTINSDSRRFQGHFETQPVFPAIAQLTDIVLPAIRRHFDVGSLTELRRVKWMRPIVPGDRVELVLVRKRGGIRFELHTGGVLACVGTARLGSVNET